jgi:hypothetical protein
MMRLGIVLNVKKSVDGRRNEPRREASGDS